MQCTIICTHHNTLLTCFHYEAQDMEYPLSKYTAHKGTLHYSVDIAS